MSLRTEGMELAYSVAKARNALKPLYDEAPVRDFKHWCIVPNRFPHDKVADVNHMIVLKHEVEDIRHINLMEWFELLKIVWFIRNDYDSIAYNLPAMSSIKNIPHCHLYKIKEDLK
jgi:hypothetical protein